MLNRPLVAMDIGSSAIKIVEMTGKKHRKLRAIGLETLPPGLVVDGVVQDPETMEGIVKGLLKKLKIGTTGRRVALALGGSSVLIRKVLVAAQKEGELAEQVFYEAEQHFQADMADIYFDYAELGDMIPGTSEVPVLLVGAKRDLVEQYIAIVRGVGMRTGVIECDVFSVANMFEYNYGVVDGLVALVNIGSSVTQVSLVSQGEHLYTRDIPIGGEEYSRQIMDRLAMNHDNAETLKVGASQNDGNVPEELLRVLGDVNDQLVNEIQLTVDYFFQNGDLPLGDIALTSVFMTGGGSRILGLDAALAATLQIPVQIVNPFQNVAVNPKKFHMDYILMQGHLYGVAVGLGLRSMNDNP